MKDDVIKRICLWSGPRNISTALMYSFAQREDTQVFDEPLYAYYLNNSKASKYHPDSEKIMSSMETNGNKVIDMMMGSHTKQVVFFKNMTHHLLNLDRSFLTNTVNIILTRNPFEMLPSFAKVIKNPSMSDVGYALQIDLLNYLHERGLNPLVVDSTKVLLNPKKELMYLCKRINIPYNDNMLIWKAQPLKEDGIWAKHWYTNIHKSEGFIKYKPKTEPFPKELNGLLEYCIPLYEELIEYSA
ncbi:MAG: hypothetical protein P8I80_09830 [Bacteroidales bacterium]|jgi:hypothetical protein|nr:hypothetical protein [Bacteroidales bacterium]